MPTFLSYRASQFAAQNNLLQMFVAMSHWSVLRPLASAALSILDSYGEFSQISCCCPVSRRSCSFGSIGPVLSQAPADQRWSRCLGGLTQSPEYESHPVLQPGRDRDSSPMLMSLKPAHQPPCHQSQLYCGAQVRNRAHSLEGCSQRGQGQGSCSHTLRAGLPALS